MQPAPADQSRSSLTKRILAPALAVLALGAGGVTVWKSGALTASTPPNTVATTAGAIPPCSTSGKNFNGQDLTNHNFNADPPGSLVNANFGNAKLRGAIFAGQNLTGACFNGADLGPSNKGTADFTQTTLTNTTFIGATLDQTDFTFANITCADFSQTSLIKATFGPRQNIAAGSGCRTKFVSSAIDVHVITTDNWGNVDFTNTNVQKLAPGSFSVAC